MLPFYCDIWRLWLSSLSYISRRLAYLHRFWIPRNVKVGRGPLAAVGLALWRSNVVDPLQVRLTAVLLEAVYRERALGDGDVREQLLTALTSLRAFLFFWVVSSVVLSFEAVLCLSYFPVCCCFRVMATYHFFALCVPPHSQCVQARR